MKKKTILLTALVACAASGCTLGLMERDIALGRDLDGRDLAFIRLVGEGGADGVPKEAELEIWIGGTSVTNAKGDRSRYTWIFPIYAERKTLVVSDSMAAVSTASEAPAIFPGLSIFLGLREEAGTSFSADGLAQTTVSFVELNPLIRFAHSREKHVTRGWELIFVKGLLGVGNSPYGPYMRLLWFIKLGEGGDYSYQNTVKTLITPLKPAEPEAGGVVRDATGAALRFLLAR